MTAAGPWPREATAAELEDWDRRTVHAPGGHVYQSRAWAEQRRRLGWAPLHLVLDAEHAALVLTRRAPLVGSRSAYVPRGPVWDAAAGAAAADGEAAARRMADLATWLGARGVDVVATDAEVPAAAAAYGRGLRAAGFRPIGEIQPSRHRVSLSLALDTDDAAVRAAIAKSTRQRIAGAERDGIVIRRYDTAGWPGGHPLFAAPDRPAAAAFEDFATLLEGTGERRGFRFGPRRVFIDWWTAAHAAGLVVYLEAVPVGAEAASDAPAAAPAPGALGGLLLYRHGDRLSTVHSADAPGSRDASPGVMHLLRWRAVQLALREGASEMDLGGVDVAPDHREPVPGDAMWGLFEHKRSFGATWVEMTGAHERMLRPWRHQLGRVTTRVARLAGR